MKPTLLTTAIVAAGLAVLAPSASAATTDPVGYNTVECLSNSDTIVGVPLRQSGSVVGTVASVGTPAADALTITLSAAPSTTTDEFAFSHYLQFTSGTLNGQYFTIGANNGTDVTIDLNGATGVDTSISANDTVRIAKYWTLNDLFPPAEATTAFGAEPDFEPNGHAIFASLNALPFGRRTEILLPDQVSEGSNLSASSILYIYNNGWRKQGEPVASDFGSTLLLPDSFFIIRASSAVTHSTFYTSTGEVELGAVQIPLATSATQNQDNHVAIVRPVDVKLSDLNLGGTSAFVTSLNALPFGRKDEILIFDNSQALANKSASAIYYYYNGAWRKQGQPVATSFDNDTIPAGAGFIIRKAPTGDGQPVIWSNTAGY